MQGVLFYRPLSFFLPFFLSFDLFSFFWSFVFFMRIVFLSFFLSFFARFSVSFLSVSLLVFFLSFFLCFFWSHFFSLLLFCLFSFSPLIFLSFFLSFTYPSIGEAEEVNFGSFSRPHHFVCHHCSRSKASWNILAFTLSLFDWQVIFLFFYLLSISLFANQLVARFGCLPMANRLHPLGFYITDFDRFLYFLSLSFVISNCSNGLIIDCGKNCWHFIKFWLCVVLDKIFFFHSFSVFFFLLSSLFWCFKQAVFFKNFSFFLSFSSFI